MDPLNFHLKTNGVHLLRLTGNRKERALQHGQVLASLDAPTKSRLPLLPLAQKNQTLITRALFPNSAIARKLFSGIYETVIENRTKNLSPEHHEQISYLLKASGIPAKNFWLSLFQPDFLMALAAISTQKVQAKLFEGFPGCTAGAFLPADELRAFFLRNLDYPLASYWERVPAVFYHEPTDSQNFLNVAALGVHLAGLTAWNESGIAFSLNAHFSKKISLSGTPIFYLGDEVIREAKSLDDAIRICRKFRTIGSWMLLVASFHERKAVSIELSDGKIFTREMNPALDGGELSHSNAFFCPEFQQESLHFSGAVREDSDFRKQEMDSRLRNAFSQKHAKAADFLGALGDHLDLSTGKNRIFGNTVSVVTTVQSALIAPNENSLYLSCRPETPTGLGPFLKLPFDWNQIDESTLAQKPIESPATYSNEFKQALHEYYEAYVLWHVEHASPPAVLTHLRRAIEILPSDANVQIQCGYFELMTQNSERAELCFRNALNPIKCGPLSPNTQAVAHYFLGASLDLDSPKNNSSKNQARSGAISEYQKALARPALDEKLKKKAEKRLKKPFVFADSLKIVPDLQFVEPLEYP